MSTQARYERQYSVLCHTLENLCYLFFFKKQNLISMVVTMEINFNVPFTP